MQIPRDQVVHVLRRAGLDDLADDVAASLPDPVDADRINNFLMARGLSRDELISRLGGSP